MNPMNLIRIVGQRPKLLDLLPSEEGNADRNKVLAVGAILGSSVLAQLLWVPMAHADPCSMVFQCANHMSCHELSQPGTICDHIRCGGDPNEWRTCSSI